MKTIVSGHACSLSIYPIITESLFMSLMLIIIIFYIQCHLQVNIKFSDLKLKNYFQIICCTLASRFHEFSREHNFVYIFMALFRRLMLTAKSRTARSQDAGSRFKSLVLVGSFRQAYLIQYLRDISTYRD